MDINAALVFDETRVFVLSRIDEVANLVPEIGMLRRRSEQLIGQSPEEAVSIYTQKQELLVRRAKAKADST